MNEAGASTGGCALRMRGGGVNSDLRDAARDGEVGRVRDLLLRKGLFLKGVNVNAKDSDGRTALVLACSSGHTDVVSVLLKAKGINVNAKLKNGRTALHVASYSGHTTIVSMLLDEGADPIPRTVRSACLTRERG